MNLIIKNNKNLILTLQINLLLLKTTDFTLNYSNFIFDFTTTSLTNFTNNTLALMTITLLLMLKTLFLNDRNCPVTIP